MTAKEVYEKAVRESRNICVKGSPIWGERTVYIFHYRSEYVNMLFRIKSPVTMLYQELTHLGDVFEEISDNALKYEDARDCIDDLTDRFGYERTGKEIKEWFTTVVTLGEEVFGVNTTAFVNFYNKYVVSEYPLSDKAYYKCKYKSEEIIAYKKQ